MSAVNSDQIREHVRVHYVEPARQNHQPRFSVRCGTIEKELGMSNRIAHVCTALKTTKFLQPNGLRLAETSGPASGTSTTVVYTYEFVDAPALVSVPSFSGKPSIFEKLREMEGILTDVYKELGGAEKAVRDERDGFSR